MALRCKIPSTTPHPGAMFLVPEANGVLGEEIVALPPAPSVETVDRVGEGVELMTPSNQVMQPIE